jgi:hypothetical protein
MPWSIKDEVSNVPPEGTYKMRIESIEPTVSKNSGEAQLVFKCKIVSGDLDGKSQTYYRPLKAKGLGFIARDLANSQVFDVDSEEAANMPDDASEVARLLDSKMTGKVFMYDLTHREYQGKKQANWELVGPAGSI